MSPPAAQRSSSHRAGRWPLLPIAPTIVAAIAVATAVAIALAGVRQLQRTSDAAAATRSQLLAATVAARLRSTAFEDRATVLAHAARQSGAEIVLVDQTGAVLADQSSLSSLTRSEVVSLLVRADGVADSSIGRVWFTAHPLSPPLEHLSVLAFVRAPMPARGTVALSQAVALLTALLLGVAVAVAYAFMRTARDDVVFVRRRLARMAQLDEASEQSETTSGGRKPVPIRSLDQVGLLSAALNVLVTRFDAAERSYRADLLHAANLDAERSQFLAGLSHELRTPLNAILGFTHVLESEADGPLTEEAREALAVIRTSGEHLRTLIDDILDLSAMETGQLQLELQDSDVHALAEDVVREARGTIKDRPIVLSVHGTPGAWLRVDPRRIRQVLTNLVSNALKFTAHGEVRLSVAQDDEGVTVAVTDTGRGIPPALVDTIFRAYRQVSGATDRRGGAGLGLAIARRLVLLHGGTIDVDSELGKGSTFTLRFPKRPSGRKARVEQAGRESVGRGDRADRSSGGEPTRGSRPAGSHDSTSPEEGTS